MQLGESSAVKASILITGTYRSLVCILSKVNKADSSSSKSSAISGSDYLDFDASMEGEHNERVYEPVGEIRPWKIEPPGRT